MSNLNTPPCFASGTIRRRNRCIGSGMTQSQRSRERADRRYLRASPGRPAAVVQPDQAQHHGLRVTSSTW
jgi:hypothetical protein